MTHREGLSANSTHFTLDGRPFRILGGSIHYFRVPRAYWRDRLLKLKACGLNTLTTYVPWNLHEPQKGVYCFFEQLDLEPVPLEKGIMSSSRIKPEMKSTSTVTSLILHMNRDYINCLSNGPLRNKPLHFPTVPLLQLKGVGTGVTPLLLAQCLSSKVVYILAYIFELRSTSCLNIKLIWELLWAYISLAAELDLLVILRPGPYICAEWDLGGLPSWLLRDKNMKLRTTYSGFTAAVDSYFDNLIPRIAPLQFKRGGPIIAVQVENEYGSCAKDENYLTYVKEALESRGITELLLTCDNREGLKCGLVKGALQTINLQKLSYGAIQYLADIQPQKPLMVMEYWSGWFDVWGEPHHVFCAQDMIAVLKELLEHGVSINLYMFHGGTSFGFMNGATDLTSYKPQINSYDYDAPLSESGDYTTKYHLLRNLMRNLQNEELPCLPVVQDKQVYEPVVLSHHISLWDSLQSADKPFMSDDPVNMENLPINHNSGQSYGYTLYETTIYRGGTLNSRNHVHDRALVFVDRHFIGILDYRTQEIVVPRSEKERVLGLLVENCGRVNYGPALDEQRKGLVGDITLNNTPLKRFTMYSLDLSPGFINRLQSLRWKSMDQNPLYPAFFRSNFKVEGQPRDTFITLPGWLKGVVIVNGENLGRHWSVGPQNTLYLPAPWLKSGDNQVIVFEEHRAGSKICFAANPQHGKMTDVSRQPFCTLV